MSIEVQRRRGSNTEHANFTGAPGELTYNTDTKAFHAHNGLTQYGVPQKQLVSVLDFGAGKPGVSDDAAFQTAMNMAGVGILVPAHPHGAQYRLVAGVNVPAGKKVYSFDKAEILVDPVADYLGAFRCTGDGARFYGLKFTGNGVATAVSGSTGSGNAAAIRGDSVHNIEVVGCEFGDFVLNQVDQGTVGFYRSQGIKVHANTFLESNEGGTDVNLSYSVGAAMVTGNYSVSGTDKFCYISSVGSDTIHADSEIAATAHHIISGNIYLKWGGKGRATAGRHGIVVHYNGGVSYAIITDNILANGTRHGIYLRGSNVVGAATGTDIVRGNIVRYFGGGENQASYWGYNSGIKIETTNGAIIDGNRVEKSGYYPDGTLRGPVQAAGIDMVRACRNVRVCNNHVEGCSGGGIMIAPTVNVAEGDYNVDTLAIVGNTSRNNGEVQINVGNRASTGIKIGRFSIEGNTVEGAQGERFLMAIQNPEGAGISDFTVRIVGNTFIGAYNGDAGVRQVGLALGKTGIEFADVFGNEFHNLWYASAVRNISHQGKPGATWPSPDYTDHRIVGEVYRFRRNTFKDCYHSFAPQGLSTGQLSFIEPCNVLINCDIPVKTEYSTAFNQLYYGTVIGKNATGETIIELSMDAAPTAAQQFHVGDRVKNNAPAAGGASGWVCTTAGTPGTWKAYGTIAT